ncbi:unnamed protein product [Linum tenue]|uniref:Formamidopyrimidine-DNA glycosylase catalytic domain-containing protein n=1 Tax=Linum tenue TaxID=586396 RepID=A0AAV0KKU5_9ROSI|nr:unnamed protein product [Linum tenue]
MPELPEVEAARRALEEHCLGKTIKKAVVADDSKVIDGISPSDLQSALVGKTIVAALRKGKNMWLKLDTPPFPSFQFGMTGAVYIKGVAVTKYKRQVRLPHFLYDISVLEIFQSAVNDTDEWPSKFSKLFVELDDGLEFSFTDKRRMAKVRLLNDPACVPPISELGPDALLEPMTVDELHKSLSKKKVAIKALLLDQGFISGIGNWIADEVLYQARIHPQQISSSLSKEYCATLHKLYNMQLKLMLNQAAFHLNGCFIFVGAKSLEKLLVIEQAVEVGADSSQFPKNWIFHSREKKSKAFVDGKKIEFITAGGRTTAYVPELQKLTGDQAGKEQPAPKQKAPKRKKGKDDADDDDDDGSDGEKESESDEEETSTKARSNRASKTRGRAKKTSADNGGDSDEPQNKTPGKTINSKQTKAGKKASEGKASKENGKKPKKTAA